MKIFLLLTLGTFLAGCGQRNQGYKITDVTKPETIILKKLKSQDRIHYLTIVGTGNIEGAGEITLMLNGKPYKTESLSGAVQFNWAGDWYSDSAKIEYKPTSVKSGKLNLQYHFK